LQGLFARHSAVVIAVLLTFLIFGAGATAQAHPLGNFTINHFARLEPGPDRIGVRCVVDMAEIPTLQELQSVGDGDGQPSTPQLNSYTRRAASSYAKNLRLICDGSRVRLETTSATATTSPGAGGLRVLRLQFDFRALVADKAGAQHRASFENANYAERLGWREIVVSPARGIAVFDSSALGSGLSNELRAYPDNRMSTPPDERRAEFSWSAGGVPAGAALLKTRDGRPVAREAAQNRTQQSEKLAPRAESRDRLAALIALPDLTPGAMLLGMLIAFVLGAMHALSPGHGKTVVGAYLIGSRGTPAHAAFLGLTVTITHTLGVFVLGLVTLFASRYVVAERLFPILSFTSGALVVAIGLRLLASRLRTALATPGAHDHEHHEHSHEHHEHGGEGMHSHGGQMHSHLPPGADGTAVTWRSLLALGISGGLLPCPSALVVLLSSIALHRVGYGLLLVVAFSIGLASALTVIGLAFVLAAQSGRRWAGRWSSQSPLGKISPLLLRWLPAASALVVTALGLVLCYQAQAQVPGVSNVASAAGADAGAPPLASLSALAVLGLGFVLGLKHATEVDHVVAVSAIVSEQRNLARAALVGGLWGVGHTASLVIVGAIVLILRVAIPERVVGWLEFGVALMIITLGVMALARAWRGRRDVHLHEHSHEGSAHTHLHFHEPEEHQHSHAAHSRQAHSHAIKRLGLKPLLVGMAHGLAGSGALTLLVLSQSPSVIVGLLYLVLFGLGSVVGMMLMSGLIGLPFVLGARRLGGLGSGLQVLAGALSIGFGCWYAYQTGSASGLLAWLR
jgi:ABC-type nickel/cobalt efflux system permease component RcnA